MLPALYQKDTVLHTCCNTFSFLIRYSFHTHTAHLERSYMHLLTHRGITSKNLHFILGISTSRTRNTIHTVSTHHQPSHSRLALIISTTHQHTRYPQHLHHEAPTLFPPKRTKTYCTLMTHLQR